MKTLSSIANGSIRTDSLRRVALLLALLVAAPAIAQFSDGYNFLKAVKDREVLKAKELIDKPGSIIINSRDGDTGETAMHIVVKRRDTPWMGFLIQNSADVNATDRAGLTPLMVAAATSFPEGVRLLLASGARADYSTTGGETALIKAVRSRDAESARLLMAAGADPDRVDNRAGLSARDYAARDAPNTPVGRLLAEAKKREVKKSVGPQM